MRFSKRWMNGRCLPAAVVFSGYALLACVAGPAAAASVYLEDLTSMEVRAALQAGKTTIIIPVGGTEQNGPHIALAKHNVRVRVLSGKIAAGLGDTLVAPVVAYVPEGSITPPSGHMKFPGTLSISEQTFRGLIEGAANSLRQHGFLHIVLIGDHGGYQAELKDIAARLNQEWSGSTPASKIKSKTQAKISKPRAGAASVYYIGEYYQTSEPSFALALKSKGLTDAQIGKHAGAADTSLTLAIDESLVRKDKLEEAASGGAKVGVDGDPRPATAALGQLAVEATVERTIQAIRRARESHN